MTFITRHIVTAFFLFLSLFTIFSAQAKLYPYIVHYNDGELFKRNSFRESSTVIHGSSVSEVAHLARNMGLSVVHIEEDVKLFPVSFNDEYFNSQWSLTSSSGGGNFLNTWELGVLGSHSTVVAVIDTGILPHGDLAGRVLPGYDFISSVDDARDGDGRDSDPKDEGDYAVSGDLCLGDRGPRDSSWHGTHVAGTIMANANNRLGITGIDHRAKLLPVRVLGKCGGSLTDIADAIYWAAGGNVAGVPKNQNPAHVINLSLGGYGPCSYAMQKAIDFANSQGAVVVVAAGNEGMNLDWQPFTPSSCRKIINVGASNRSGSFTGYSNRGDAIDVAAPGGDYGGTIVSLSNSGDRTPEAGDNYRGSIGTSMAAPHVSGLVALIRAINPGLYPAQVEKVIKETTQYIYCPRGQCGSGLIDSLAAITLAETSEPDASVVADEAASATLPVFGGDGLFEKAEQEDGSATCGTIDLSSGDSHGGPGSALFSFLFMALIISTRSKWYRFKRGFVRN